MENTVRNHHSTKKISKTTFSSLPLLISLLGGMALFSNASADTSYEVQSGDSLSKIVAKNYPDVSKKSYNIIMQHILKSNPDAFSNENINSLRLGKTLNLTSKEKIKGLQPAPPKPTPINPQEFKKLQSQNAELEKQVQALKEKLGASPTQQTNTNPEEASSSDADKQKIASLQSEVEQLQARIKKFESEKEAQTSDAATTEDQQSKLDEAQTQIELLKTSLDELKVKNKELSKTDTTEIEKQLADAKTKIEEQTAQISKLEADNEKLSKVDTTDIEKQLADAKAKIEEQTAQISKLEADNEKLSKVDTTDIEKQLADAKAKIEEQATQISKLEAEKAEKAEKAEPATKSDSTEATNQKVEDLQAEIEILNALVAKYEAEQESKPEAEAQTDKSSDTTTSADSKQVEDLQAEIDILNALVAKYEAEQEASGTTDTDTATSSDTSNNELNAELEKLKQENSLLQTEIDKARNKAIEDNKTIAQLKEKQAKPSDSSSTAAESPAAQEKSKPSTWLNLSLFSWLLPLLAILIGLYLLSRLIKRNRDKKATEDFKTAMSTSVTSNTASAFGIDGSAPAPAAKAETEDDQSSAAPNEEDSLEAGVKIDIAKAYIEFNDTEAANEMLQEAIIEGSAAQRKEAESLLKM